MNASKNAVSAALQAVLDLHANGSLVIYSGTKPASADAAVSGDAVALVTGVYAATPFGAQSFASSAQQADANFTAASYDPAASGTASWARAYKADGTTVIADYTVGTSGADVTIGSTTVVTGTQVSFAQTMDMPLAA